MSEALSTRSASTGFRAGRHVDGRDQRAGLRDQPQRPAQPSGHHRRRPRDAAPRIEPHPRLRQRCRRRRVDRGDHRAGPAIQPAPRPEHPAPQPDAQSAAAAGRKLALEIRPQPLSAAEPGDASRRAGASRRRAVGDRLPDAGRARRRERRVPRRGRRASRGAPAERALGQDPGAGHTVQGDNPKGLVAELRGFLAKGN